MSKKTNLRIGIPGWGVGENSYGVGRNYLQFASKFGRAVIITPEMTVEDNAIDILLLPGGPDTNPKNYGQVPGFWTGNADVFKEYFCTVELPKYVEAGIPVFGICLGMQALAVHFGSQLTQNLLYHPQSTNRWEAAHDVHPIMWNAQNNELSFTQSHSFEVNSHHHQGVYLNQLGPDLIPTYVFGEEMKKLNKNTPEMCVVEAFMHNTFPIVGIQWHPEEWYDGYSVFMMETLCNYYVAQNADDQGEKIPFSAFVEQTLQQTV